MNELSTTDVMANEDVLVFSETEKVQPRSNLVSAPLVNYDTDRKWISQKESGSDSRKNFHQNRRKLNSEQKKMRQETRDLILGRRVRQLTW